MEKAFCSEYLGILVFFYSNEHEPIHVHARKGEFESKAEFYQDGEIIEIRITFVKGHKSLTGRQLNNFKDFLNAYANKIVEKWVNYLLVENYTFVFMDWRDHIEVNEEVLVGKPVIKGTRLSVEYVINLFASGWTEQQILDNYPRLTKNDLQAFF